MNRLWSLFFLLVPILGVGLFVAGPYLDAWLPHNVSVSGAKIDQLFYVILIVTSVVFVITQVALSYYLWRYGAQRREGETVHYSHGHFGLECIWTLITGVILVALALWSQAVWNEVLGSEPEDPGAVIEVTGRRFEWRVRYPGEDGKFDTPDDIYHVNDVRVPVNRPVIIRLKADDVLHSFALPSLRVKQDCVPGMTIPIYFTATETGTYDLVCSELCGWGHYAMVGVLTVQDESDYQAWLADMAAEQERDR